MPDLLTTREVAEREGVHVSTVTRWVARGVLVPARVLAGPRRTAQFLFAPRDVDRLSRKRSAA